MAHFYAIWGANIFETFCDTFILPKTAITRISIEYAEDATAIDVILSILYMAMIAEEQKKNTRLGKRIKRLGIHVLLIEDREVRNAANFMRGMGWRDIDRLCRERGF